MKNLSKYIQNLNFEYAISYSGLKGEKFTNLQEDNKQKIESLKKEIESARFMQISKLKQRIKVLEDAINLYSSRIITNKNEFHQSTVQILRFEKGAIELADIFDILNSPFEEQHVMMCPPIFRDAIVFYSKENAIQGILQICFSCTSLKNENEEDFEVDYKIFTILREKLVGIGHEIEHE